MGSDHKNSGVLAEMSLKLATMIFMVSSMSSGILNSMDSCKKWATVSIDSIFLMICFSRSFNSLSHLKAKACEYKLKTVFSVTSSAIEVKSY